THPLNFMPGDRPVKLWGSGSFAASSSAQTAQDGGITSIIALAPMVAVITRNDTGFILGGVIEDINFDGNKLAAAVMDMQSSAGVNINRVSANNAAPFGTNFNSGAFGDQQITNSSFYNQITGLYGGTNDGTCPNGAVDLPLYNIHVQDGSGQNNTDSTYLNI